MQGAGRVADKEHRAQRPCRGLQAGGEAWPVLRSLRGDDKTTNPAWQFQDRAMSCVERHRAAAAAGAAGDSATVVQHRLSVASGFVNVLRGALPPSCRLSIATRLCDDASDEAGVLRTSSQANIPNMSENAARLPSFPGLAPEELVELLRRGTLRSIQKNTIVVSEGDETDSVFFILGGRVKVYLGNAEGKEVVVNTQGPGEYFGEMSLEPGGRSASVMALETSRIAVVRMADFRAFLLDHPQFQQELVRKLIRRVRALSRHVRDLALLDVYGRVVRALQELAREEEGRLIVPEKMSQQAIANLVGASREMVSRILKDLRVGGYLGIEDRRIVILRTPPPAW